MRTSFSLSCKLTERYVWDKTISEWVPKSLAERPYHLKGVASTPPTRIIADEELPYFKSSPVPNPAAAKAIQNEGLAIVPIPTTLIAVPLSAPTGNPVASAMSIDIEELPADTIDTPHAGRKVTIFSILWEYLTLYWRK
jgi:hypothetical protein